jgi:hypothetical protein
VNISTILNHIDSGHTVLPDFQRGYVWNCDQVRGAIRLPQRTLFCRLLLAWATQSQTAPDRDDRSMAASMLKFFLDSQQHLTSLPSAFRQYIEREILTVETEM